VVHKFEAPRLLFPPLLSEPVNRLTVAFVDFGPYIHQRPVGLPICNFAVCPWFSFDGFEFLSHEDRVPRLRVQYLGLTRGSKSLWFAVNGLNPLPSQVRKILGFPGLAWRGERVRKVPRDDGVHDEFQTFKAEMSIAVSKQAQLEVIVPIALGPFGLGAKGRPQLHVAALSIVRLGFAIEYAKHAHQISEPIRRATVNPVRRGRARNRQTA
jgi:hypothetical protein